MALLFDSFADWKAYCDQNKISVIDAVLEYEFEQKGRTREQIMEGLGNAWEVMKEAVRTGL